MPASNWESGAVAGYFANPEDAHRVVRELLEEGFDSGQIGAALHSETLRRASGTGSAPEVNNLPLHKDEGLTSTPSGATSGTSAVSPWGLFTGGGTPFAGASRPGPITGSDVPPDMPRELPSEFASEHAYSGSAFESSFCGMGIPRDHAHRLAQELGRGGAVVTVNAGTKVPAAEAVMRRNHGVIRYEAMPGTSQAWKTGEGQNARVQVFGEVHRAYPGYVGRERERKAS